jgi:hypothetical protein
VRELLAYEESTGIIRWRVDRGRVRAGDVAGCECLDGRYWIIGIERRLYLAHIVAWVIKSGAWPDGEIDHRDTDGRNNRWSNLRDVPHNINMQNLRAARINNQAGLLGVTMHPNGRFRATIVIAKKQKHLGYHDTPDQAHQAYLNEKRRLHVGCTL